ncbi:hypothetical protein IF2G_06975 [Cordyceps javanica]|nr:hypothetical protein IF2G_06975 [Cordyceps javanica]
MMVLPVCRQRARAGNQTMVHDCSTIYKYDVVWSSFALPLTFLYLGRHHSAVRRDRGKTLSMHLGLRTELMPAHFQVHKSSIINFQLSHDLRLLLLAPTGPAVHQLIVSHGLLNCRVGSQWSSVIRRVMSGNHGVRLVKALTYVKDGK